MAESGKCSQCGAELIAGAPGGHCLRCILQFGLGNLPADNAIALDHPPIENDLQSDETYGRFERYRLIEKLGEGGSGIVYRAEQLEPVRRGVAIKVIKLGMDTKSVIGRFEAERQALALMDHPNIARVFDAGASDTGRPFFVMELVRGVRITEYCDRHRLSARDRLKLFIPVCQAIQHAHQKGVIHRDLKPSNILVAEHDRMPMPKVIDFGIAKATGQQRLADQTIFTAFDQFMGTPAYMSPEQAGFGGQDIDTRSDTYSLGVLLYELLTGRPPFDPERLRRAAVDEILRLIREEDPPRPSMRLTTLAVDERVAAARARGAEPEKLRAVLRGDLDWIVMKALEKDRARRYETANGLARDIERYLNNEAVTARPPSVLYRWRKFARRNRAAFLSGAAILLALLVGLGVSLHLLSRESRARRQAQTAERRAKTEAAKSGQIARFLEDMLRSVRPSVALGRDTTLLREVLSNTTARVDTVLTNQPALRAEVCRVAGDVYLQLGDYAKALPLEQQSLALCRSVYGEASPAVAEATLGTAAALMQTGRMREAEQLLRESPVIRQKLEQPTDDQAAESLFCLANAIAGQGRSAEAERLARRSVAVFRQVRGEVDPLVADHMNGLANILRSGGKPAEANLVIQECLDVFRKLYPEGSLELAQPLNDLGFILHDLGDQQGAEQAWKQSLALRQKFLPPGHPATALTQSGFQMSWRDPVLVAREVQEKWRIVEKEGGFATPEAARLRVRLMLLLGMLENNYGNTNRARECIQESLVESRSLPVGDWGYYLPEIHLGYYLQEQGRYADAENSFAEAINRRTSSGISNSVFLAHNYLALAYNQLKQEKFDEADRSIQEGWTIFSKVLDGTIPADGLTLDPPHVLAHLSVLTTNKLHAEQYLKMGARLVGALPSSALTNLTAMADAGDGLAAKLCAEIRRETGGSVPDNEPTHPGK